MTDLHTLLLNWEATNTKIDGLEIERHALEVDIAEAMKEDRAEYAEAPGVQATLKGSVTPVYTYLKMLDGPLAVIAEQLSPEELEAVLNNPKPPAREFLIPAIKKLAKRGGVFKDALDKATLEQPARLRVRSVE